MNHTPFPWTVEADPDNEGKYIILQARREQMTWAFEGWDQSDEEGERRQKIAEAHHQGNRRLIEAIPAMLRAVDMADTAFVVLNIGGGEITPQARSCYKKAWGATAQALAEINPDGAYAEATKDPKSIIAVVDFEETRAKAARAAVELLRGLFDAFPALDPAANEYDEGVDGAEVVQWMGENATEIRALLDAWATVERR